ncbi:MAG TPA: type IX secretion system membrane protein PorP/SprF, partial [Methanomassiliicoccaceae archaeon]|nr:type IX secretion system membrane protein PorP/SprF [Methanomassiliicoccaceae archaeon]
GKRVGMGAMLMNDKVASLNKYKMQLSYAYNWVASEGLKMGIGLNAEFHQLNLDKKAGDNSFQQPGDPAILEALDGAQYFDATAGIYGNATGGRRGGRPSARWSGTAIPPTCWWSRS